MRKIARGSVALGVGSLMVIPIFAVEAPIGLLPLALTAICAASTRLNWAASVLLGATLAFQVLVASAYGWGLAGIWVITGQLLAIMLLGATLGAADNRAQVGAVLVVWLITIVASLLLVAIAHTGV